MNIARSRMASRPRSEIIERLGGRVTDARSAAGAAPSPIGGWIIHEVGTTRMGTSAADSVTDSFGKTWDIDNLVVADGGVFTSNAHKNPTLTIMALAWRSMDTLAERMRKGRYEPRDFPPRHPGLGRRRLGRCPTRPARRQAADGRRRPGAMTRSRPLTAAGYGQDPDLQHPAVPWPLTLNPHQRDSLCALPPI